MPEDATQADIGAEIYRLVCSTCHGDKGQGLTDEWRQTLDPANQNCWQSKCHASNYPVDGFALPHYVPPVVGPAFTTKFKTAADVNLFIRTAMPYQVPGTLLPSEYWQLTAYLLTINGYQLEKTILDESTGQQLLLHPS
ncbi:MAG TPA: c-type cytochrome [Anaerolineae bacterium]|nr:c-type cytochrome [Anaerolineae bacterium]